MLQFYLDSACTLPVDGSNPKKLVSLLEGQTKHFSLWLKDTDTATYDHYLCNGNIQIFAIGSDLGAGINIALKRSDQSSYGYPGLPVTYAFSSLNTGVAVQVDVEVTVDPGAEEEFTNWELQTSNLCGVGIGIVVIPGSPIYVIASAFGYVNRTAYALSVSQRVLPETQFVADTTPGFIFGEYRWRDENTRNATPIIKSRWDIDPDEAGVEKFIAGIGANDDLAPVALEEVQDSIYMDVHSGSYFTGPHSYYLPAGHNLEFLISGAGNLSQTLQQVPRQQRPIFVGTYKLDKQGFYEKDTEYRYIGVLTNPDGSARIDLPSKYFTFDRKQNLLTLSIEMEQRVIYLGLLSGQPKDYFDLSVYPVDQVQQVFVDRGVGVPRVYSSNYTFDREQGTVIVQAPAGSGVSIPGGTKAEAVYALVDPAVAVLYETGTEDTRLVDAVDLNPAFSGLSDGYLYLQHRRQKPVSLILSCDKPRIDIPLSVAMSPGMVAFGPVYFEGDYALLSVTAYSQVPGETVPNARLKVLVDNSFTGTLNYKDPLSTTVEVITGGDGTANLIYIPKPGFGYYIPTVGASGALAGRATTHIANDTLVLPAEVPISQIRNDQDGWLTSTYFVRNNNPLFGMVGAVPSLGEITFATFGSVGTIAYRSNGMRDVWKLAVGTSPLIRPIEARDASGNNYTDMGFNGLVKKLVYATAVPLDGTVGAYFVTFLQRVPVQIALENSDVFSNIVLLEMAVPEVILENPWLRLEDDTNGRLTQYRLGYVRDVNRGV